MKKRISLIVLSLLMLVMVIAGCGKIAEFDISFISDGETVHTITTSGEERITLPQNPQKEGYVFEGWYWDDVTYQNPFTASSLLNQQLTANMSVYAKWTLEDITKQNYDLTFNSMGGSTVATQSILYGNVASAPTNPTKTGYIFAGWYKEADYTTKWNFSADTVTENTTVYAKWVAENDAQGSAIIEAPSFEIADKVLSIEIPNAQEHLVVSDLITVSPYATYKVTTDIEGINEIPSGTVPVSVGDTTFYILVTSGTGSNKTQYTVNVHRRLMLNVTYDFNNGSESVVEVFEEDSKITSKEASKTGYTFVEWQYNSTAWDFESDVILDNMTLEATYTANKYTVSFNSNGGNEIENVTVTFDAPFTFEIPTRLGYTFDGWRNAKGELVTNNQGATSTAWTVAEDTALFAQWTPIGYEINYHNVDGAENNNMPTYDVEDQPLELVAASKLGYRFIGWYTDEKLENAITEIAVGTTGTLDLYAKWEAIEYTATFIDGITPVAEVPFTVESESIENPSVPEHIGYTGAWESYALGANDITVNAVYTPIVYTITYEGTKDVENTNPATYTIESATITLDNLSLDGYTFDGWTKNGEAVTEIASGSTGDIVLTANWTAIKYNITYMYDSAIGDYADTNKNPLTYTIEDDFDFIALVNKTTGYTFDGWYTEKNVGTGTKVNGIEAGSMGDITVYAQWALEEYTITYHNANGVTNTNATTYTVETNTFEIFDISKNGYNFDGWYSDSEFGTQVSEIFKGTTGNIDLYAKWTPTEYTIEYVLYGGTYAGTSNPESYTIEDTITFNAPTLDGYTFVGFFTLNEGGERVTGISKGTTGNKTFYARYIAFDTNGGSEIEYELTITGNKISKPTEPEMDYYTFVGWYKDEALTEEFDFSIPTKTLTLYAKFEPTVYKITYVLNGGTNPQSQVIEYTVENTLVTLLNPSKTGYTFVGWFTDDKFTSSVVTKLENEHGDKTFYANYKINQYTISFNTNGGTEVEAITQNYQTSVTAPSAPAKNGYNFEGWYSDSALKNKYTFTTMPANDVTLYAKWSLKTYNITYNLEGGTNNKNNPSTFNIQSADITLQAPTKTGYKFVGWYTDNGYDNSITKIANGTYGNIELYAKWEIITYKVTYNVNGATHSNATTYTVETDLTYLSDATLKGHAFGGWYKDSAYSTRVYKIGGGEIGDITLYAKFTANVYDVYLDGTEEAEFDVSFNLNGGSGSIATQTITESNTLKYPSVPTRNGYVFGGWYTDKDCTGKLYDFTALITSDITLYAKWVETDNSIAVNSNVNVTLNGREEQKFTFVPLVSGNVTFTTTGSYDTLGILYDADGNVLKTDDDTGSDGVNFQIVFNVTAGEVYTISVSSFSSATSGTATLYVSGSNTVNAGGYVVTGNKTQITFGSDYTIDLPTAREGYKFLGWADEEGNMYTDGTGASIKAWDIDGGITLVSVWERTVYTVTFVTSGGSAIDPVTLAYGERLDISKYVTTRANYTFDCWMYNGAEFEATTMPDYNITLTAKWKTFALGDIKYDDTKLAVSVNDEITADLFGAICLDTNGQKAEFTVTVSGTQEAGQTISVRLVAKSGTKTKQVTITGVQVYGAPTLTFDNTVDYVNLVGGMTATHFGASGTDTFGNATEIKVYIEGDYKAGDIVTVTIESIDPAGNVTRGYVENVKAYGLPEIIYNEEKTDISVNDTINADLFGASAKDSFGNDLTVTISLTVTVSNSGTTGNTVTIRISATDSKGNVTNVDVVCKVYSAPTISDATTTGVKESDTITPDLLGITGKDSFGESLDVALVDEDKLVGKYIATDDWGSKMDVVITDTTITFTRPWSSTTIELTYTYVDGIVTLYSADGTEITNSLMASLTVENDTATAMTYNGTDYTLTKKYEAGTIVTFTAIVTDPAGNVTTKIFNIKIYGTPTITYDREAIKLNEKITVSALNAVATDSFGNPLTVTLEPNYMVYPAGKYATYTLVATDHVGNTCRLETDPLGVYDIADIEESFTYNAYMSDLAKLSSNGSEFDASATDTFGNACIITIEAADGSTLAGGQTTSIVIVATDPAGNRVVSDPIENIRIFDMPTVEIDEFLTEDTDISFMATVYDSFGQELYAEITLEGEQTDGNKVYVTVKATDDAGNELNVTYTYVVNHTAHVSSDWIVDKEASCAEEGSRHKECTMCERVTETETISKLAHTFANGYCTVCGREQPYTRVDDDTILFGSYPQTEVTDSTLKATLDSLAGALPTSDNAQAWTSYGYYASGSVYMWYIDIEEGGEKYRGVYFTLYRLSDCRNYDDGSYQYTNQYSNGYTTSNIYWFKYEPISWTILNENNGTALIHCDMIIDSQQFDYDEGIYSRYYNGSTIRAWLNDNFYNTAFDKLQKEIILTTTVDNSTESTGNQYYCDNSNDKVFLLSYKEYKTYIKNPVMQQKKEATDYAKSQGNNGEGAWWLRSPYDTVSAYWVKGTAYSGGLICRSDYGVVPALNIKLLYD